MYNINDIVTYGVFDETHYRILGLRPDGVPNHVINDKTNREYTDSAWNIIHFKKVRFNLPKTKEELLYSKIKYLQEKHNALQSM